MNSLGVCWVQGGSALFDAIIIATNSSSHRRLHVINIGASQVLACLVRPLTVLHFHRGPLLSMVGWPPPRTTRPSGGCRRPRSRPRCRRRPPHSATPATCTVSWCVPAAPHRSHRVSTQSGIHHFGILTGITDVWSSPSASACSTHGMAPRQPNKQSIFPFLSCPVTPHYHGPWWIVPAALAGVSHFVWHDLWCPEAHSYMLTPGKHRNCMSVWKRLMASPSEWGVAIDIGLSRLVCAGEEGGSWQPALRGRALKWHLQRAARFGVRPHGRPWEPHPRHLLLHRQSHHWCEHIALIHPDVHAQHSASVRVKSDVHIECLYVLLCWRGW